MALASSNEIHMDRLTPTKTDLKALIASADQPMVFRKLLAQDSPLFRWTPENLAKRCDGSLIKVAQNQSRFHGPQDKRPIQFNQMTLHEYVTDKMLRRPVEAGDQDWFYLQDLLAKLPYLAQEFDTPDFLPLERIMFIMLWMGGGEIISKLHYDSADNLILQVQGRKRYLLFAPHAQSMYPYPLFSEAPFVSRVDVDTHSPEQFPNFSPGKAVSIELNPGDALYLPIYWWHQVYSLDSFNVNVNVWWKGTLHQNLLCLPQYLRFLPLTVRRMLKNRLPKA